MAKKKSIKTEWDLKRHFYTSERDPDIRRDIDEVKRLCEGFEAAYKGRTDWLKDEDRLLEALEDYERLESAGRGEVPIFYFFYRKDIDSEDKAAEASLNKLSNELTGHANKVLFFRVALSKLDSKAQQRFLASKKLEKFRYFLKLQFEKGSHTLSEPEERVLNLASLPASEMWVNATEKFANRRTVRFGGKDMPLSEAMNVIPNLPVEKRRKLHVLVMEKLREVAEFSEAELTAVYTAKKIEDELRGYKEPYDASIQSYENDRDTVMALVDAVTSSFGLSRRFYNLKKRLLKLPHLEYPDRSAPIGKIGKKMTFEESFETLRGVFGGMDPRFQEILESMVAEGRVDVYPKKGKTSGAYCNGSEHSPTVVLLNHVDELRSYVTFAHEMGHAVHTELSKAQSPLYQNYTLTAAEVASTLFESFAFERVFEGLSDRDKAVALHDRLNDTVSSVFRQIAFFNFEVDLHKAVREKGSVSREEVANLMNRHMKSYIGPAMKFDEKDGYFFVAVSHIRRFFYVYAYSYGKLISNAMYRRYKEDPAYMGEIKKFLSAGGSASPDDIFRSIGIDTRDPRFWEDGLKQIEDEIKELERLTK